MKKEVAFLDSLQGRGIRPGLLRMRRLLRHLGHPQRAYRTIIIAGTNGKGSTSATLAAILRESGYRTGLYTSPHLVTLLERWKIDGVDVSPSLFRAAVRQLQSAVRDTGVFPTYFEALTLLGFMIFREVACDVVVLEVGMGGRLDATNVTEPVVAAISSVSFDHTEYLGDTLAKIAMEKAGVIPQRGVAVTSNRSEEVLRSIRRHVRDVRGELHLTTAECRATDVRGGRSMTFKLETPVTGYRISSPLVGDHQIDNITLAVRAAELAEPALPRINATAIERGVRRTEWRGRLERATAGGKRWLIDGAHNPDGVARLIDYLDSMPRRKRILIFAAMRDKDVSAMAQDLFSRFDRIIFTQADAVRGMPPEMLRPFTTNTTAMIRRTPGAAFTAALRAAEAEIIVAGSLYLAGAAVAFIDRVRRREAKKS